MSARQHGNARRLFSSHEDLYLTIELTTPVLERAARIVMSLPSTTMIRSLDAIHLACAEVAFATGIRDGLTVMSLVSADRRLLAVACDGRADDEAGLTLPELADALVGLGAVDALNLDGGGSTSLVCGGRLRNVPRESHGVVLAGGRAIPTALTFRPTR